MFSQHDELSLGTNSAVGKDCPSSQNYAKLDSNSFLRSQGTGSAEGDSATDETQRRLRDFRARLDELSDGKRNFTFVMDDPTGNSYLQVSQCDTFLYKFRSLHNIKVEGSLSHGLTGYFGRAIKCSGGVLRRQRYIFSF